MPLYYLKQNLTFNGELYPRKTTSPLKGVSEKSLKGLIEQGLIYEIQTPPLSVFAPLNSYATMLETRGIKTLSDFATADSSMFPKRDSKKLAELQKQVREMIDPNKSLPMEEDCCGDSPISLEIHKDE